MATINGGTGADTLVGTTDSDVISGLAGNDTITGGGGNDTMYGGSGDDRFQISGISFGDDIYDGGDGADIIYLSGDVAVSQFLLTSANVIATEALDFSYRSLSGTGGNDVFNISGISTVYNYHEIDLLDGDDQFVGYLGNDAVDGGAGNDTLAGSAGNDTLIGSGGNDSLDGGSGDDVFRISGTDVGYDIYNGGIGADEIYLAGDVTTAQFLLTSANVIGTETLDFSYRSLSGTGGNDLFNISGITTVENYHEIDLYDGNDRFTGYLGNDAVDGGAGNDTLIGGAGSDTLTGSGGNDHMLGESGNDVFRIGGNDVGADIYNGGTGADVVYMTADIATSQFLMTAANVIATETLDMSYRTLSGTGGNDLFNLTGMQYIQSYKRIYLYDGNDNFTGFRGDDNVDGGAGNDTLVAWSGNDTLIGGSGDDVMNGGTGNDYFYISGTDFGNDRYVGGDGADTIFLTGNVAVARFVLNAVSLTGTETLDMSYRSLAGTGGNDYFDISGLTYVNNYHRIDLLDGNDYFRGYRGNDAVDGGAGNDTLVGGAGNDTLRGGTGSDSVNYVTATGGVQVNLAQISAQSIGGGEGIDTLDSIEWAYGSNYSDRLTGNAGSNVLSGNAGNDVINGGAGNDLLVGGVGVDTVYYATATSGITVNLGVSTGQNIGGGMGADVISGFENITGSAYGDRLTGDAANNTIIANGGNDIVVVGAGNDTIYGGSGSDLMVAGDGNDMLWGQSGNEIMFGGAGADRFVFQINNGTDRIDDWQNGTDRLVIQGGTAYDSISELNITSIGGNAVVSFAGTTITLVGVSVAQLDASDFQFI